MAAHPLIPSAWADFPVITVIRLLAEQGLRLKSDLAGRFVVVGA